MPPLIDPSGDVSQTLQTILSAVGEKILNDVRGKDLSLADLGLVVTILQKLIDCHSELKPSSLDGSVDGEKTISSDTIDAIQTQLNLF
jgi:hypothetical protein